MIELLRRDNAGRSATRRYKDLEKRWRQRRFGRRYSLYFWVIWLVLLLVVVGLHLSSRWALSAGLAFGAAAIAWLLLPETLVPAHIFNWQLGAWGEQMTASELKALRREGWIVRHDLAWGNEWNHDHVAARDAVFLINSRNAPDGVVTVEGGTVRVGRVDLPGEQYIADKWAPSVAREARSLERQLERELGFRVAVYPVIAIWAKFESQQQYVGEVSIVQGRSLVEWLKSRPADLLHEDKRARVAEWIRRLPRA